MHCSFELASTSEHASVTLLQQLFLPVADDEGSSH